MYYMINGVGFVECTVSELVQKRPWREKKILLAKRNIPDVIQIRYSRAECLSDRQNL